MLKPLTRQIDAPSSKPSADKITWNWKGVFYPNPEKAIRVRKTAGLTGTVVEEDSWLYTKDDWVNLTKSLKKMATGGLDSNINVRALVLTISIVQCVELLDKEQKIKNEKYWGTIEWA
ncbi:hypothetical protein ACVQ9Z_02355 [Staphylococcus aureus]